MRQYLRVLSAVSLMALPSLAQARVQITVDLSSQSMHVDSASGSYDWKVSTGRFGHATPSGTYNVQRLDINHHSAKYDNAPMPYAMFFHGGYAIHGAYHSAFGHPASHGCVRLPVDKAALLYSMVRGEGASVQITGVSPASYGGGERLRPHHKRPGGWRYRMPPDDGMGGGGMGGGGGMIIDEPRFFFGY